jgi:hypothetical protein
LSEFVEPVLVALSAGVAMGMSETASTAVKDAYQKLKDAIGKMLRRQVVGEDGELDTTVTTERMLADPEAHRADLATALERADPDEREDMLAAARKLLELVGPHASTAGKYRVNLENNLGVQVGDHNTQTNTFGA